MGSECITLEELKPGLVSFGQRHHVIDKLEVFGSMPTGDATTASDLDILVTFGKAAPRGFDYFDLLEMLKAELVRDFDRKVDLVDRPAVGDDLFGYNAGLQAKSVYERA